MRALARSSRCSKVRWERLIRKRKKSVQGKLEETVIGFSIDNGGVPYAGALNYPLRGAKVGCVDRFKMNREKMFSWPINNANSKFCLQATLYEGGVRSPGFIHAPNILPRSSIVKHTMERITK